MRIKGARDGKDNCERPKDNGRQVIHATILSEHNTKARTALSRLFIYKLPDQSFPMDWPQPEKQVGFHHFFLRKQGISIFNTHYLFYVNFHMQRSFKPGIIVLTLKWFHLKFSREKIN